MRYRNDRNGDYRGDSYNYSDNSGWREGYRGQERSRDQRYPPPARARGRGGNRQWDEYEDNTGFGYKGGKNNFRNRY